MIICNGNKIHDLAYDITRHWIHLKYMLSFCTISTIIARRVMHSPFNKNQNDKKNNNNRENTHL